MKQDIETVLAGLPVQQLLDRIDAEHFGVNRARQSFPGTAHSDTESIILRGPRSWLDAFAVTAQDTPLLAYYIDDLMPTLAPLLAHIECKDLGRVMIVKLKPGGRIAKHRDTGPYSNHYSRFHICLDTSAFCTFTCGATEMTPVQGESFIFNHKRPHHVANLGGKDRIHLIVDAVSPHWTVGDDRSR